MRLPKSNRTAAAVAAPPVESQPAEPLAVGIGIARVYQDPAPPEPTAEQLKRIGNANARHEAAKQRVEQLAAELKAAEAEAEAAQRELNEASRPPPPRTPWAQAVAVVTRGHKLERLIPIDVPQTSKPAAFSECLRLLPHLTAYTNPLQFIDAVAARPQRAPAFIGDLVAAVVTVPEGGAAPEARRLVIRGDRVLEAVQVAPPSRIAHARLTEAVESLGYVDFDRPTRVFQGSKRVGPVSQLLWTEGAV